MKKLPPETHENDDNVDSFVAEAKITVTLNHPHVVRFVGVTWTSASDLCVVQELMKGGDMHCWTVTSGDPQQPQGEERAAEWNDGGQGDQLRHVTQAEAQDVTSATLWMTPEIIRGEVYSTDADMFSFSVVLSELDMLSDPYAQARQQICDSSRCPLQEADILQKVTQGSLRVVFFESGPMALAELRLA
ncbi:TKL protein kinase [Phytophthora cinnamomi]|uniref:TKL protein kinase n=1 Tax=Phytophthora cinnamomi TaxID=4785 RepID=UPI00355A8BF4|nr:TKL protein kinase [Phytophthora cinnamomi]